MSVDRFGSRKRGLKGNAGKLVSIPALCPDHRWGRARAKPLLPDGLSYPSNSDLARMSSILFQKPNKPSLVDQNLLRRLHRVDEIDVDGLVVQIRGNVR